MSSYEPADHPKSSPYQSSSLKNSGDNTERNSWSSLWPTTETKTPGKPISGIAVCFSIGRPGIEI